MKFSQIFFFKFYLPTILIKSDFSSMLNSIESRAPYLSKDLVNYSLDLPASKNFKFVTPILGEEDYPELINNIEKNRGNTDLKFRRKMAQKVFRETSKYDNNRNNMRIIKENDNSS